MSCSNYSRRPRASTFRSRIRNAIGSSVSTPDRVTAVAAAAAPGGCSIQYPSVCGRTPRFRATSRTDALGVVANAIVRKIRPDRCATAAVLRCRSRDNIHLLDQVMSLE